MVPAGGALGRPVEELDERSRALLRWMIMFGLAVGLWEIWHEIVPALGVTHRIRLWSYTVATPAEVTPGQAESAAAQAGVTIVPVHLGDLLLAVILAAATVVLATNGPSMVEILLLTRLPIDPAARFAIAAILRYIILVVGLVLAFGRIDIKWSQIQWVAAAICTLGARLACNSPAEVSSSKDISDSSMKESTTEFGSLMADTPSESPSDLFKARCQRLMITALQPPVRQSITSTRSDRLFEIQGDISTLLRSVLPQSEMEFSTADVTLIQIGGKLDGDEPTQLHGPGKAGHPAGAPDREGADLGGVRQARGPADAVLCLAEEAVRGGGGRF